MQAIYYVWTPPNQPHRPPSRGRGLNCRIQGNTSPEFGIHAKIPLSFSLSKYVLVVGWFCERQDDRVPTGDAAVPSVYDPTRAYRLLTAAVRSYHPSICPAIQSIGSVDQPVNLSVRLSIHQSAGQSITHSVTPVTQSLCQSLSQSLSQSQSIGRSVNPSNQSGSGPFPPRLAAAPALFPGFSFTQRQQ